MVWLIKNEQLDFRQLHSKEPQHVADFCMYGFANDSNKSGLEDNSGCGNEASDSKSEAILNDNTNNKELVGNKEESKMVILTVL